MEIQRVNLLALTRGGTAAAGFVVLVVILALVICKRGLAGMVGSTQTRLMTYLLISTAAYLLALGAQIEHYWTYSNSHRNNTQGWKVRRLI